MSVRTHDARPIFFGDGRRLFGFYHPPNSESDRRAGVVICNPIGDDMIRAHRALRHLAERLAEAGFAVLRFDFDGTGDSAGSESDPDRVETWIEDIGVASRELGALAGTESVSWVGLRLGATLAMTAAARAGNVDSLVLWGAYASGDEFVADVTQVHRLHTLLEPHAFSGGPRAEGGEEALGFFLTQRTIDGLKKVDLHTIHGCAARAALVIETQNAADDAPLASHLRSLGVEVTLAHHPGHKFLITTPHHAAVPDDILENIVTWLSERHPRSEAPAASGARIPPEVDTVLSHPSGSEERPLRFGSSSRLFGILHRPAKAARGVPGVIMLNAGCVHRTGAHRLYVPLARRWADLGFSVFRVDLSGIGDSPAPEGCPENLTYPRDGLADVRAAMDRLEVETGADRFVVLGLCSGADIAFQLGIKEERVAGVFMLNPRTFCVHDLGMVDDHYKVRWYRDSLSRGGSWKKLLRGDVDIRRVAKIVVPRVTEALKARAEDWVARMTEARAAREEPAERDVPRSLREMVRRGVDAHLVVAEGDPGIAYVDAKQGAAMRELDFVSGFRRTDVRGTDHTFTALWAQSSVGNLLTEHLSARHLRSKTEARSA